MAFSCLRLASAALVLLVLPVVSIPMSKCSIADGSAACSEAIEAVDNLAADLVHTELLQTGVKELHKGKQSSGMLAVRVQFVDHDKSFCSGAALDPIYRPSGEFASKFGEWGNYQIEGNDVKSGKHIFHGWGDCLGDDRCKGFGRDTDGYMTYWHGDPDFSWEATDLPGFHCFEKQRLGEVRITSEEAANYIEDRDVRSHMDASESTGMNLLNAARQRCKKDIAYQMLRDYATQMQELNDNFGYNWIGSNWYLRADGLNFVETSEANSRLEEFDRQVDALAEEFESNLSISCGLQ